jgi:hypothetical protein
MKAAAIDDEEEETADSSANNKDTSGATINLHQLQLEALNKIGNTLSSQQQIFRKLSPN